MARIPISEETKGNIKHGNISVRHYGVLPCGHKMISGHQNVYFVPWYHPDYNDGIKSYPFSRFKQYCNDLYHNGNLYGRLAINGERHYLAAIALRNADYPDLAR